jgi:hypothetical protein
MANPNEASVRTVYCTQWASCGWKGKRAVEANGVQPKPCPKCGKDVTA